MFELKQVTKSYPSTGVVLNLVDFMISENEKVAIVGASGSGKSTLLQVLGLLDDVSCGELLYRSEDIFKLSSSKKTQFRLNNIGFVFQFHHLIPEMTVWENISLPSSLKGFVDKEWLNALLDYVGLKDCRDKFPWQMSGGEQQRVAIARSLVNKPRLILTDEATGNLDHENSLMIMKLFEDITKLYHCSVVSVTHDRSLVSFYDRCYSVEDKKLILQ